MTRSIPLIVLSLMLYCAAVASGEAAEEFIISYWWGPPVTEDTDRRYAEVAECNFTHASFPGAGGTVEQNKAILDACQKHGLKFIVHTTEAIPRPQDTMLPTNLE